MREQKASVFKMNDYRDLLFLQSNSFKNLFYPGYKKQEW